MTGITAFISRACVEPDVCTPPNSLRGIRQTPRVGATLTHRERESATDMKTPETASKAPMAKNLLLGNARISGVIRFVKASSYATRPKKNGRYLTVQKEQRMDIRQERHQSKRFAYTTVVT